MSKVTCDMSMSVDGFVAGPRQSLANPFGEGVGDRLHRPVLPMSGGTTFTFVTDGIESALAQAREAAGEADIAVAGGAHTVNQYLAAGLIDELRLHVAPLLLGAGERLFDGGGDPGCGPGPVGCRPGL